MSDDARAALAWTLRLQINHAEPGGEEAVMRACEEQAEAMLVGLNANGWRLVPTVPVDAERLRERLVRDFASAFIRIRGAHNPNPGEPCAWCQLAAEQAAEAMVTADPLRRLLALAPAPSER